MDYGFFIAYRRCFLNSGLLFSRNRWTLISLQLWTFISQQPSTFIFLNLWPGPSILKTCGLLFSTAAQFIWTMDIFIACRQCFLNSGLLLSHNRWNFIMSKSVDFYYVKLVDFFYLKNGGLLLFQNRWTFIHSNPNILFSKLVDFYFQQLRSLFGLWIFISLTGGVFLTVDFYFLKIGGLLLHNSGGLLFP